MGSAAQATTRRGDLHVSFVLGDRSWRVSCIDGVRGPSRYSVNAGDQAAVLECMATHRVSK